MYVLIYLYFNTQYIMFGQYNVSSADNNLNLGCGQPSEEYISDSFQLFNDNSKMPSDSYEVMQYGKKDGHGIFKQSITATFFSELSEYVNDSHIFMTNGVSQGIPFFQSLIP